MPYGKTHYYFSVCCINLGIEGKLNPYFTGFRREWIAGRGRKRMSYAGRGRQCRKRVTGAWDMRTGRDGRAGGSPVAAEIVVGAGGRFRRGMGG